MWVNLKIYYKCGYRPKMFSERKLKKKKKEEQKQNHTFNTFKKLFLIIFKSSLN